MTILITFLVLSHLLNLLLAYRLGKKIIEQKDDKLLISQLFKINFTLINQKQIKKEREPLAVSLN